MTSLRPRDPSTDHLLTGDIYALLVIDFQRDRLSSVASMDRRALLANALAVARTAMLYTLPVVVSTTNVRSGESPPTILELVDILRGAVPIDRTAINAWEDGHFVQAVRATGRKKLIMLALWSEASLVFPALDAMRDGFEVYPVADAIGGSSFEAHRAGLKRITQAGAQPVSWTSRLCELQRDWNRHDTATKFAQLISPVMGR